MKIRFPSSIGHLSLKGLKEGGIIMVNINPLVIAGLATRTFHVSMSHGLGFLISIAV